MSTRDPTFSVFFAQNYLKISKYLKLKIYTVEKWKKITAVPVFGLDWNPSLLSEVEEAKKSTSEESEVRGPEVRSGSLKFEVFIWHFPLEYNMNYSNNQNHQMFTSHQDCISL